MSRWRQRVCLQDGLKLDLNRLAHRGFIRRGAKSGPIGSGKTGHCQIQKAPQEIEGGQYHASKALAKPDQRVTTMKNGEAASVGALNDEPQIFRLRQEKSVAYSGAHEALIVEPSRGTPLPFRAMPFSRKCPWPHSRVSKILRRDACILSASFTRSTPCRTQSPVGCRSEIAHGELPTFPPPVPR
jgi:hypothetical protein